MGLQRKQNNLRKAQARFDKVSRRSKQFQIEFVRGQNSRGKFKTKANIVRGEKQFHGNNRGLIHKAVNLCFFHIPVTGAFIFYTKAKACNESRFLNSR